MAVPVNGQQFPSWKEAEAFLENYAARHHFVWSTDTSNSIASENKKLQARGETPLYDPNLQHKNITLCCLLGGKKRIGSGSGVRPLQTSWKTNCPVKVHLIALKDHLFIKEVVLGIHNHETSPEVYKVLPKVRQLTFKDPEFASTVFLLFKAGVKPSKVRMLLRSMGSGRINARDLQNYRQKLKRENLGCLTPEQKLVENLAKLLEEDPGVFIYVGKTEEELNHLFIQTSCMRKNIQKFGHILLMDHTYKVNVNRMPVTVFMTMDGHGDGRSAGYAFVANELLTTVKDVMEAFKSSIGDEVASKIRSVTVDKDYTEISAIKQVFKNVVIQLCDFHVSRTFNSKVIHEDSKVKEILKSLRYCWDDLEFNNLVDELRSVASENFMRYFEKNWLSCPKAWSCRDRKKAPNLGNSTTGRLENLNGKIKIVLDSNKELYEAVDGILELVKNKDDVTFRNVMEAVKETYMTNCSDPVVAKILMELTRFAANLLIYELRQKPSQQEVLKFKASIEECSCPHWLTYLLPCLSCRQTAGKECNDNAHHSPTYRSLILMLFFCWPRAVRLFLALIWQ